MSNHVLFPPIGHDSTGRKRPFQVTVNGDPWAGFDSRLEAEAARDMWQKQKRPGKGANAFTFEVLG